MEQQEQIPSPQPETAPGGSASLSSNTTLFWRVFLPVFGTVFLTGLMVAFLFTEETEMYLPVPMIILRVVLAVIWLGWAWLIYKTLWQLKRLDATHDHLFVTNYWTTARYPWADVAHFTPAKTLGKKYMVLTLKAPGRFGQNIPFIPSSHLEEWLRLHERLHLLQEKN